MHCSQLHFFGLNLHPVHSVCTVLYPMMLFHMHMISKILLYLTLYPSLRSKCSSSCKVSLLISSYINIMIPLAKIGPSFARKKEKIRIIYCLFNIGNIRLYWDCRDICPERTIFRKVKFIFNYVCFLNI